MADRKKDRKGARKPAASKPKAAARVAATVGPMGRLPIGGGWGESTEPVPFEGMGTGAIVPVQAPPSPSDSGGPTTGHAASEILTISTDWNIPVGTLTVDAEIRNHVKTSADNLARLFEQIGATLAVLRGMQAPDGDNHASERNEAIGDFEVYIRLGATTIRVVQEQAQSQVSSKAVVEQNAAAFETVEIGAKSFRRRLSELAGVGLGAVGRGALQEVGKVAADQIGALLLELPNLIGALHHWATLIK
jgi:hypothetical protein